MRVSDVALPHFIEELIRDPYGFRKNRHGEPLFSLSEIKLIHDLSIESEKMKPNVIQLNENFNNTLIIGDIHGDIISLTAITKSFFELEVDSMIFLGDYVDRGKDSLLVLIYLLGLNLAYPNNIQLLRGNHEDQDLNRRYGFSKELERIYSDTATKARIHDLLDEIFNFLCLSALTPNKSMCMHGGIPIGIPSIRELNLIPKPHSAIIQLHGTERFNLLKDYINGLLWNDPSEHISVDFSPSPRGMGLFQFSQNAVTKFLEKNSIKRIVRAHESTRGGFANIFEGQVLHIFSTQPYFNKVPKAHILHEKEGKTIVRDLDFKEHLVL